MLLLQAFDLDSFQRQLDRAELELRAEMRAMTVQQAEKQVAILSNQLPANQRTASPYSFFVTERPNQVEADIYSTVGKAAAGPARAGSGNPYALGTRPHRIDGHPLRWFDKQGVPHFAMFVMHPGTKSRGLVGDLVAGKQGR